MATANTFPAPVGPGVSFTQLAPGATTPNFVLEPGLWIVSLELYDRTQNLNNDQVTLVQVTAGGGLAANSTVLTMTRSGYFNLVVGPGALLSFNFQTTNGCANVRANKPPYNTGPS